MAITDENRAWLQGVAGGFANPANQKQSFLNSLTNALLGGGSSADAYRQNLLQEQQKTAATDLARRTSESNITQNELQSQVIRDTIARQAQQNKTISDFMSQYSDIQGKTTPEYGNSLADYLAKSQAGQSDLSGAQGPMPPRITPEQAQQAFTTARPPEYMQPNQLDLMNLLSSGGAQGAAMAKTFEPKAPVHLKADEILSQLQAGGKYAEVARGVAKPETDIFMKAAQGNETALKAIRLKAEIAKAGRADMPDRKAAWELKQLQSILQNPNAAKYGSPRVEDIAAFNEGEQGVSGNREAYRRKVLGIRDEPRTTMHPENKATQLIKDALTGNKAQVPKYGDTRVNPITGKKQMWIQ